MNKKFLTILTVSLVVLTAGFLVYKYRTLQSEIKNQPQLQPRIETENQNSAGLTVCLDKCGDKICQKTDPKCTDKTNLNCICQESAQDCPQDCAKACGARENSLVTKVIDGDTVVAEGGYSVRLIGVDADEKNYPCYEAAKTKLEQLILGKKVRLEKDQTDVDQYGRCLRTIFLNDQNINLEMVKDGLAVARFYEPDVKYKNAVSAAEQEAIAGKLGCKWQPK